MMAGNRNKVFPAMSVKREPPPVSDASRRRATITRKWDSLEKELKSNQNDTSVAVNRQQSETMSTSTFDDVSSTSSSYQTTPSPMNVYHRGNRSERRNTKSKKKKEEPKKKEKEKEKDATTALVDRLHSSLDNLDRFLQMNLQDEIFLARKDLMPKHFEKSDKLRKRWRKLEQDLVYEELLVTINDAKDRKKSTGSNPLTPIGEEPDEKGPKSATSDSHRLSPEGASSHDNDVEQEKSNTTKGKGSSKGKAKGRKEDSQSNGSNVEKSHTIADIHHMPEQRNTNSQLSSSTDVNTPKVPSEADNLSKEQRSSQKISVQSDKSVKRNNSFESSNVSVEKRVSTVSNHRNSQSRKTSILSKQSNSNITLLSKQSTIVSTQSTTIGDDGSEDGENDEDDDEEEEEEYIEEDDEEIEEDDGDEVMKEDDDEEDDEEDDDDDDEDDDEEEEGDEEGEEEDIQPLRESVKHENDDSQIKSLVEADVEDDEIIIENEKLKEAEIAQEAVSERDSVSQCSPGRKDSTEEEENENSEEEAGEEEEEEEEEEKEEEEEEETKRNSAIASESRSERDKSTVSKASVLVRQENVPEDFHVLDKDTTDIGSSDVSYVEEENDIEDDDPNDEEDEYDDYDDEGEDDEEEEEKDCEKIEEEEEEEEEEEVIETEENKEVTIPSNIPKESSDNQMNEDDQDTEFNRHGNEQINTPLDIQIKHKESTYVHKKDSISTKEKIVDQTMLSDVRSVVNCVLVEKKTSVVTREQKKITVDNLQTDIENQNQKKRSTTPDTLMGDGCVYIHRPKKQRKKERPPSTPHSRHGKRKGKYEENPYIATANEIRRQIHPTRAEKKVTDGKTKDHKTHSKRGKAPKILGLVNELTSSLVHVSTSHSTHNNPVTPRSRLGTGSHSEIDIRERNKRTSKSKSPSSQSTSLRDRSGKRNVSETSTEPTLLSVSSEMMTLHKDKMRVNPQDRSASRTHSKSRETKTHKKGKVRKETDLSPEDKGASLLPTELSKRVRKDGEANLDQPRRNMDHGKSEVEIKTKESCISNIGAISEAETPNACRKGSLESIPMQKEKGIVRTKCDDDSEKSGNILKDKANRKKSVKCKDEETADTSLNIRSKISKQEGSVADTSEGKPERRVKKSRKFKGNIAHKESVASSRDEGMDVMNYVRKARINDDSVKVKAINRNDTLKSKTSRVRCAKKSVFSADAVTSVYDGKVEVRTSDVKHKKKAKDKKKRVVQKSKSDVDLESQATSERSEESTKHRLDSQPVASKPSKVMMERAREAKDVYTPPRPSLGEKRSERVKAMEEIRAEEKRQEDRIKRKKKHDAEKKKSKSKK